MITCGFSLNTSQEGDVSQFCAEYFEPGSSRGRIERLNLGFPQLKIFCFQLPSPEYREETKITTTISKLVAKLIVYRTVREDEDLRCFFPFVSIITRPVGLLEKTTSNELITEINLAVQCKWAKNMS